MAASCRLARSVATSQRWSLTGPRPPCLPARRQTVRFAPKHFVLSADERAVAIAHERPHTVLRMPGHPGSGDNPFCVAPHLGAWYVTTSEDALGNAYGYEWLTYARVHGN
jgi:hypothetical protein